MNIELKRSIFTMILFCTLFLFITIDFAILGPSSFLSKPNTIIVAGMVLLVMLSFFYMLYQTKSTRMVIDERDKWIQLKASTTALQLTVIYVFLLAIVLYIIYEDTGNLPVSWMWFLAYSSYAFAFLSTSSVSVLLYYRQ
jgi:uncharacterized membrane protein